MWKNMVKPDWSQMTIWRMRIAYWMTKVTNTPSQHVILITYALQQWLHERASKLRYSALPVLFYIEPQILKATEL
jgi:hypothetical protein